jgi:leader peptidase (prepilin peptidase)/N-methyltransferase
VTAATVLSRGASLPWVAAAGAVAAGAAVGLPRGPLEAAATGGLFAMLAAASVVDLRERRIPNVLTYSTIALALAGATVAGVLAQSAAGMFAAAGLMGVAYVAGRGRLGLGDVKLSAAAGAALGVAAVPVFLLAGTAAGAAAAAFELARRRDRSATLPYGPWLAVGAAVAAVLHGTIFS